MPSQVTNPRPSDSSSGFLTWKPWIHSLWIPPKPRKYLNEALPLLGLISYLKRLTNLWSLPVSFPFLTLVLGRSSSSQARLSHRSSTSATSGPPSWRIHHLPSLYGFGELLISHDIPRLVFNVFPSSINNHLSFAFGIVPSPFSLVGSKEWEPLESMYLCCIPLPPFSFLFPFSLESRGVKSHFLGAEILGMSLHLVFLPCL